MLARWWCLGKSKGTVRFHCWWHQTYNVAHRGQERCINQNYFRLAAFILQEQKKFHPLPRVPICNLQNLPCFLLHSGMERAALPFLLPSQGRASHRVLTTKQKATIGPDWNKSIPSGQYYWAIPLQQTCIRLARYYWGSWCIEFCCGRDCDQGKLSSPSYHLLAWVATWQNEHWFWVTTHRAPSHIQI